VLVVWNQNLLFVNGSVIVHVRDSSMKSARVNHSLLSNGRIKIIRIQKKKVNIRVVKLTNKVIVRVDLIGSVMTVYKK
jgi:hypothetical protein